ncbi:ABC transporter F family member 3 [Gracilariopsis chorda]|uniref:Probable ATP-dependent transporter ycf16 n=1 Tax=Gracilariopsis chorda TaxID=448386 RepID=A0A2V3ITD1_9FLOR|nr:ABC transporter F family member 3 [Gracilariopsis chorda]|eukprot:PXF45383.1 ABC transporter F family member 3 [Gracilariopsis chorda]
MVGRTVTLEDARDALSAAMGLENPLTDLDSAVVQYLTSALADSAAAEDEVVDIVSIFLPQINPEIALSKSEEIARNIRRQLHGAPTEDTTREKLVRLSKATRLGASVGIDSGRRKSVGTRQHAGNANQTLDRSAEAERAKEAAAVRRARRVGAQVKTYQSEATVSSVKAKYTPGSSDIHIEGLDLAFGGMSLLEGAELHIPYGRRVGVVGRNGCGKTTLMRAIARRELPIPEDMDSVYVEQEIAGSEKTPLEVVLESDVERQELLTEEEELNEKMEEAEAAGKEPEPAVTARLAEVYERLGQMDADKAKARAASILDGLGFSDHAMTNQTVNEFSGGWRMRISLASALFLEPRLLLLDEPSNHLDAMTVIWLGDYLSRWPHTIACVSHDRAFLNEICTDVIHVKDHKLHPYSGNYDDFEKARRERMKELERVAESQEMKRAHIQKFVDKFRYNAKRASMAQSRLKMLQRMDEDRVVLPSEEEEFSFTFPDPGALTGSHASVQICEVAFGYQGQDLLFQNLDFSINMDSRTVLLGPNGAGKSTLLKLLLGENIPIEGEVKKSPKLRIGYFSQHHMDTLVLWRTPLEHMKVIFPDAIMPELRSHLAKLGVRNDQALRPINTLSGGQKSRVALAVITFQKPHILILDEPTNHLDIETLDSLIMALNSFNGGLLVVTHDARLVQSVCDTIYVCEDGRVTEFKGEYQEYRKQMVDRLRARSKLFTMRA